MCHRSAHRTVTLQAQGRHSTTQTDSSHLQATRPICWGLEFEARIMHEHFFGFRATGCFRTSKICRLEHVEGMGMALGQVSSSTPVVCKSKGGC